MPLGGIGPQKPLALMRYTELKAAIVTAYGHMQKAGRHRYMPTIVVICSVCHPRSRPPE